jgi:hypothetical protein
MITKTSVPDSVHIMLADQDPDYGYELLVVLFFPILHSTEIKPGKQKCLRFGTALSTGLRIQFFLG